jgi:hypothetical protein
MSVRQLLLSLLVCFFLSLQLVACSSSGGGAEKISNVRKALISSHGEEGGLDALLAAFSKGYSLRQIVDGALSGRIALDGDILEAGGGTLLPVETAVGTLVEKDRQVLIEARFVNLNANFLQNIGIDFGPDMDAIDVPLELRETGHSVMQIFDGIDAQTIRFNNDLNVFGIQNNTTEFILGSVERQNILQLLNAPTVIVPDVEVEDEAENQNSNENITENDILIQISPTQIQAQHIVGQTELPQRFGNFVISNAGAEVLQVEIGEVNQALTLSENGTFLLGGGESKNVDVDFNGKTQLPFVSEIPVVGRLFRDSAASSVKRNLTVFVTAQIFQPGEL